MIADRMHVQYNLLLLSRMHSRKHKRVCACVSVCVHDKKPEVPPAAPTSGAACRRGKQSLCGVPPRPPGSALGFCVQAALACGRRPLVAAAGSHHHVAVLFEDDVGAVVEVEHRDGMELRGGAAGLGNRVRVDEVNLEGGV